MSSYKLKQPLPGYKIGEEFHLSKMSNLVHTASGELVYAKRELRRTPEILKAWFEKIPEQPKTVWALKEGNECWVRRATKDGLSTTPLRVEQEIWTNDEYQNNLREHGYIFLTKEECEQQMARDRAEAVLKRDTKGFAPGVNREWFQVYYNYASKTLLTASHNGSNNYGTLAFSTREEAIESTKEHEKEWKIYFGVEIRMEE